MPAIKRLTPALQSQISPSAAELFRRKRISFSVTIKNPLAPATSQQIAGFSQFKKYLGDDPVLIQREVSKWSRLDEETPDQPFYLEDARTNLHFRGFEGFTDDRKEFDNLVDPAVLDILRDNRSLVYNFLNCHPALASVSFHIGAAAEKITSDAEENLMPLSNVLSSYLVSQRINLALESFMTWTQRNHFRGQILLENLDYHRSPERPSAYEYVTEPEFMAEIYRKTGAGLLVDVAHLLVSAGNLQKDSWLYYSDLIWRVNLASLREIHLSLPKRKGQNWLDKHRPFWGNSKSPEAKIVLGLFKDLLEKRNLQPNPDPLLINLETPLETAALDLTIVADFVRRVLEN